MFYTPHCSLYWNLLLLVVLKWLHQSRFVLGSCVLQSVLSLGDLTPELNLFWKNNTNILPFAHVLIHICKIPVIYQWIDCTLGDLKIIFQVYLAAYLSLSFVFYEGPHYINSVFQPSLTPLWSFFAHCPRATLWQSWVLSLSLIKWISFLHCLLLFSIYENIPMK